MALGVVAFLAVLGPLAVFFATRDNDADAPAGEVADSDQSVSTGAGEPDVPLAPVPTPVPTPETPAASASGSGTAAAPTAVPAPVVTQLAGESPAVYKVTGIATGSALNVRQSAGTTNPLLGTLGGDATGIAGTGRRVSVDGSEWREIKFKDGSGWVFAGYLAVAPAPAATAAPVVAATPVPVTILDAQTPGIYAVRGLAAGSSLNVRAEPGPTERLLGTLSGTTSAVPSTGQRAMVGDTEWLQVGFRDGVGWVNSTFLLLVPEVPQVVQLPSVAPSTVGIVALTSPNDRLVLRAEPGYDKTTVATVGASSVNVSTTGQLAKIGSETWAEITVLGRSGWVPNQLTIPNPRSASDVLATSGVAAVTIDKVNVGEDGTISIQVGTQTLTVAKNTTVLSASGSPAGIADWAAAAKSSSATWPAEVTVVGNQVTRIWIAA